MSKSLEKLLTFNYEFLAIASNTLNTRNRFKELL